MTEIEKLVFEIYKTNQERIRFKKERAKSCIDGHKCSGEKHQDVGFDYVNKTPCYEATEDKTQWCDDCKITQPIHDNYVIKAEKLRVLKSKLTNLIKKHLKNSEPERR